MLCSAIPFRIGQKKKIAITKEKKRKKRRERNDKEVIYPVLYNQTINIFRHVCMMCLQKKSCNEKSNYLPTMRCIWAQSALQYKNVEVFYAGEGKNCILYKLFTHFIGNGMEERLFLDHHWFWFVPNFQFKRSMCSPCAMLTHVRRFIVTNTLLLLIWRQLSIVYDYPFY